MILFSYHREADDLGIIKRVTGLGSRTNDGTYIFCGDVAFVKQNEEMNLTKCTDTDYVGIPGSLAELNIPDILDHEFGEIADIIKLFPEEMVYAYCLSIDESERKVVETNL